MIISALTEAAAAAPPAEDAVPDLGFAGEQAELSEISTELLVETHNLTVAMARFEMSMVLSEASEEDPEKAELEKGKKEEAKKAGAGDWFKRQSEHVAKMWQKFVSWLMRTVENLYIRVLNPRNKWLDAHKAELMSASDFHGAKASWGKNINPAKLKALPGEFTSGAEKLLADVESQAKGGENTGTMADRLFAQLKERLGVTDSAKSISAGLEEAHIGAVEEVSIDKATVEKAIQTAMATYENVGAMKSAKKVADKATADARSATSEGSKDEKARAAQLHALAMASAKIVSLAGALLTVNNRANSISMSLLVAAHGASKKKAEGEKKPEGEKPAEKPAEGEKPEPKKEAASALSAFL